ncbi:MAG: hypothetical protein JO081_20775, partial [Alphaproteobacteria bacterium]|nr:hypothetical protein [Alphaproteobacteria bacterium]
MLRRLRLLAITPFAWLIFLIAVPAPAVGAEAPPPAHAVRADAPPPPAQAAPVSADELQRLVDTLQDDAARAKLVAQLQALIAAQRGAAAQKTTPVGPALFEQLSQRADAVTGEILAGVAVVID